MDGPLPVLDNEVKVDSNISDCTENCDLNDIAKNETSNSHVMLLV